MPTKKTDPEPKDIPGSNFRLHRSETDRVVGGVCGGLGEYFNIDSTIIRLIFILITIFGGSGVLIYLILWLVIPSSQTTKFTPEDHIKENAAEMRYRAEKFADNIKGSVKNRRDDSKKWLGLLVIVFGLIVLLNNFGLYDLLEIRKYWPLLLVILGLSIVLKR